MKTKETGSQNWTPFFRTPYNYDTGAASDECTIKDFGPSLTLQSQAADADINVMMARMGITGGVPPPTPELEAFIAAGGGGLGDVEPFDYHTALQHVRHAEELFMTYPGPLRAEFDNDPGRFLAFCANEANRPRMEALGLLKGKPPAPETSHDAKQIIEALKGAKAINSPPLPNPGTT